MIIFSSTINTVDQPQVNFIGVCSQSDRITQIYFLGGISLDASFFGSLRTLAVNTNVSHP